MIFSSFEFIFIFLPIAFFGYYAVNVFLGSKISRYYLIISSLYFYSAWDFSFLPILLISIVFNFSFGILINKSNEMRQGLTYIAVIFNLLLLFYFKYFDFIRIEVGFEAQGIVLPLAISFFTFQQIAFIVDTYKYGSRYSLTDYTLFVVFFPQLIAGPIVHHSEMMPQFKKIRLNYSNVYKGFLLFSLGLFKKVVIADTLATYVDSGFSEANKLLFWDAWGAALSYTFQLYYDFSGYATMAIGLGLLFNIRLPTNFNNPYRACNIQDFWRRWHITLSNWLKSYIYIPLGGNRKGFIVTLINVFITAFVSGVWHGANWTFVLWGGLHGIAMIIHRVWSLTNIKLPLLASWLLTFIFIVITWVIFRSENVDDAIYIICSMLGMNQGFTPSREWVDIINSTIGVYIYKEFSDGNNEFIYPNILLLMFLLFPILKKKSMQTVTTEKEIIFLIPCSIFFVLSIMFQFGYDSVESTFLYFDF